MSCIIVHTEPVLTLALFTTNSHSPPSSLHPPLSRPTNTAVGGGRGLVKGKVSGIGKTLSPGQRQKGGVGALVGAAPKMCGPGRLSKDRRHGFHGTHGR